MTSDRWTANQYSSSWRFDDPVLTVSIKEAVLDGPHPLWLTRSSSAGALRPRCLICSSGHPRWRRQVEALLVAPVFNGLSGELIFLFWLFVTLKPGFYLWIGMKRVIVQPRSTVWDRSAHKSIRVQTYCRCSVRKIELHSSAVQSELLSLPVGFIAVQS